MTRLSAQLPAFDFTDLDLFAAGHPHHIWRALRAQAPVYWHERPGQPGFWLVTKHADVLRVSRDTRTFVSQRGVGLPGPTDWEAPPDMRAPPAKRFLDLLDPPDHTRMRRIVSRAFTPQAVARLEPTVRDLGIQVLDQIVSHGSADFVQDFAAQVPLAVLSALMGLPQDNWQRLAVWTQMQAPDYSSSQTKPERVVAANAALDELTEYLRDIFCARKQEPRDDLISHLLMLAGQDQLTEDEVMWFCLLLVGAGHETTGSALSGGVVALLKHREQLLRLTRDPSLLDTAVEEIFRWTSPVVFFSRFVVRDTTLQDRQIHAGQRVLTLFPSANYDEEVFEHPDHFDIGREPNDHVAFGAGNHFCLGAALARLQLRTLIPLVFERLPQLELAGTPEHLRSNFIAGYSRIPIRFG